jgi:hypothetical protein
LSGISHCGIRHPDTLSFIGLPFDYIYAFMDEETVSWHLQHYNYFNDDQEAITELLKYLPALAPHPNDSQARPNDDFEEMDRYRALFANGEHPNLDDQIVSDQERRAYANLVKLYHGQGKRLAKGKNGSLIIVLFEACQGDFVVGPS